MKRQHWQRIIAALHDAWLACRIGRPLRPLKVRSFRWLISSDLVPRGYENGQAPWRMLIRSYFMDLPAELTDPPSEESIFQWRNYLRHLGHMRHRTKSDNAPPEITCGGRAIFSQHSSTFNRYLLGDWLVVLYIWATDSTWLEKADIIDLVSHDSVTG
jgi:hypothetical protein